MGTFVNVYERTDGTRVFGQLHLSRESAQCAVAGLSADDGISPIRAVYRIHIREQRRAFQLGHPGQPGRVKTRATGA